MKRWKKWLLFIILIMLIAFFILPLGSAQLVYEQGQTFNLKVPCEFNGTYCSVDAVCNITIIGPNSSTVIDDETMKNQYAYHNYTIDSTLIEANGVYQTTVVCSDQGYNGINTFEIQITPNGEIPTTGKSIVDLAMLLFLIVLFVFTILGLFTLNNVNGRFALYWLAHILAIAITFIAWQTASGILSYSPFVGEFFRIAFFVILIAFLPMFFLSIFFIIKYHFINKNVMELVNAGYDEETAHKMAERIANDS